MKQPMGNALWFDCETDDERAVFFRNGRAYDTGVIAKDLAEPLALAFEDAAKWRKLDTPPWGPDAVPLMACPAAGTELFCVYCQHRSYGHWLGGGCPMDPSGNGACPACVQVGWRERSKL